MLEVKTTQVEWPRIGRYIGSVNDVMDDQPPHTFLGMSLDMPACLNEEYKVVSYQSSSRVYGDEIELHPCAKSVNYLLARYKEGYIKDISWP